MDNFMDKLAQKFSAQEMIRANSQAEAEEMKRLQLQVSEYEKILQEMRKLNYRNTELSEKLGLMIGDNADKIQGMKEEEQRLIAALRDLTDEQTRNREAELERKEEERAERERTEEERAERERKEKERIEEERAELERKEKERAERERTEELQKQTDLAAITNLLEDKFEKADDFVHKENVKVYRNVQAVVVDEIKRCTESAQNERTALKDELKKELSAKLNKVLIFCAVSTLASVAGIVLLILKTIGIF